VGIFEREAAAVVRQSGLSEVAAALLPAKPDAADLAVLAREAIREAAAAASNGLDVELRIDAEFG
jgi:hypothetical protein